ncbi:MAG TPA: 16S rRNA (cytidine(1402)-2'-O)-methyltransferase [Terriglobales bacterium]|jgi:16S rRNA (cytidine1402-2'-O)-methyltransferase
MAGTLYLIATPIGNLEDISFRAVRLLGEVDVIACEDTRHSRTLLDHYHIRRPTVSYHRLNEAERGGELLDRLAAGENVALISDAGTPLVSDPGARLITRAAAAGVNIVPVPGASAALAALMASGVEEPVLLAGFVPARTGERQRWFEAWARHPGALVVFETPHRILASLEAMEAVFGNSRSLTLCRELTKLHEQVVRGSIAAVRAQLQVQWTEAAPRGEFTLVVGPPQAPPPAPGEGHAPELTLTAATTKEELKRLARQLHVPRSELYRRWQQLQGKLETDRG